MLIICRDLCLWTFWLQRFHTRLPVKIHIILHSDWIHSSTALSHTWFTSHDTFYTLNLPRLLQGQTKTLGYFCPLWPKGHLWLVLYSFSMIQYWRNLKSKLWCRIYFCINFVIRFISPYFGRGCGLFHKWIDWIISSLVLVCRSHKTKRPF